MDTPFVFIGNRTNSDLKAKFAVYKFIKSLNKEDRVFCGFRKTKNSKYFLVYGNLDELKAVTFVHIKDSIYEPEQIAEAQCELINNGKQLFIHNIEVFDEYRGQGVGSSLLDFIKKVATTKKADSVTLDRVQTFTNGEIEIPFVGGNEDSIRKLKNSGKPVVDKNKVFYLRNQFEDETERKSCSDVFIPMTAKNLQHSNEPIKNLGQLFKLEKLHKPKNLQNFKLQVYKINKNHNIIDPELLKEKLM